VIFQKRLIVIKRDAELILDRWLTEFRIMRTWLKSLLIGFCPILFLLSV